MSWSGLDRARSIADIVERSQTDFEHLNGNALECQLWEGGVTLWRHESNWLELCARACEVVCELALFLSGCEGCVDAKSDEGLELGEGLDNVVLVIG